MPIYNPPYSDARVAITDHEQAADPHSQYLTEDEANSAIGTALTAHSQAVDPHGQYLTGDEANSAIGTALTAHAQAVDPHPQYLKDAAIAVAVAEITGTWSTTATSYTQLGGVNFKFSITAQAGDRILIFPPAASWDAVAYFRLQRNGADILLGDAVAGKEQVTWGANFSGGSRFGVFYYGLLPIGLAVIDIAPSSGTFEYSIVCRVNSGSLHLGRNVLDSDPHQSRNITQFYGVNLGQPNG